LVPRIGLAPSYLCALGVGKHRLVERFLGDVDSCIATCGH
jgi:hypothetical protein